MACLLKKISGGIVSGPKSRSIRARCLIRWLLLMAASVTLFASTNAQNFPLSVDPSHRFLTDQTGAPVYLNGDAAWSLIVQPNFNDASQYLTDRVTRGYNAVLVNLIEHHYADYAPANIAHVAPFTGSPFTTPNEAYFAHADSIINLANQLGLVVLLAPIYLGYQCGDEGWCAEVKSTGINGMKTWGQYVGNRYRNYPNIVWVIGGDTDPSPVRAKVDSMVAALRSADVIYPNRLITAHAAGGAEVATYFPEAWLSINNIYTWNLSEIIPLSESAYARVPGMPFIFMEGNYEGTANITLQQIRAQAYWSFLRGAAGHIFGNNPIWYFGSKVVSGSNEDWMGALGSPGNLCMQYFDQLVVSKNWSRLVPDLAGTVLTSGAMSGTSQAVAAYTPDSLSIVGYMPSRRTVTIDPSVLTGNRIHVQWYRPSAGTYTDAGIVPKATGNYTPPASGDWVLTLDAVVSAPAPPALQSPINGDVGTVVNPVLQWTASGGASAYEVQVATDAGFTNTVIDRNDISATYYNADGLFYSSTYYWRVKASNTGGASEYSPAWSFTTEDGTSCCVGFRGNIDNDPEDQITIQDVTYLVQYMFKHGPPPPCPLEADVDGSTGEVDVVDLVRLESYMFKGYAAPAPCPMDGMGRRAGVNPDWLAWIDIM